MNLSRLHKPKLFWLAAFLLVLLFLRFGIESSAVRIQARQGWFPQETVTLYPSEALSLNDADFFPWFNNDVCALQGVSRKALEDGVRLPDGFYRFTPPTSGKLAPLSRICNSARNIRQFRVPIGWVNYFSNKFDLAIPDGLDGFEYDYSDNGKYLISSREDFTISKELYNKQIDRMLILMEHLGEVVPGYI